MLVPDWELPVPVSSLTDLSPGNVPWRSFAQNLVDVLPSMVDCNILSSLFQNKLKRVKTEITENISQGLEKCAKDFHEWKSQGLGGIFCWATIRKHSLEELKFPGCDEEKQDLQRCESGCLQITFFADNISQGDLKDVNRKLSEDLLERMAPHLKKCLDLYAHPFTRPILTEVLRVITDLRKANQAPAEEAIKSDKSTASM